MLFGENLLFVHVPKTAGTAITQFLIDNLRGPVTLTQPSKLAEASVRLPALVRAKLKLQGIMLRLGVLYPRHVTVVEGKRHERLGEARATLARLGRRLEDFRTILAVVRNPYDLEVSRYHFHRLGYHGVRGLAHGRDQKLAMEQDFEQFAIRTRYAGRNPAHIEDWYEIDGRRPENLRIMRFENLENDLQDALRDLGPVVVRLPRVNATEHGPYTSYLTARAEDAIFRKYRWLFDRGFYARESIGTGRSGASHDAS